MNIWQIIILSTIQGATEWLPISSSGLLLLAEIVLQIKESSLAFEVLLHLGSLLVLILFFWQEIKRIIGQVFRKSSAPAEDTRRNWFWYLVLTTVCTAVVGYFLYKQIDIFRTADQLANWYFVTSALLLATKFFRGNGKITWWKAIVLGIVQGLAVIPSLSRSGAVLALAFIMRVNKKDAFDYTFITAIPAIAGAFLLTVKDLSFHPLYLLGIAITMIVGYATLELLQLIVKKDSLYLFFIITLGLGLLIKFI